MINDEGDRLADYVMNNLVWNNQRNLEDAKELFDAYVKRDTRPPEIRTK